MKPTLFLLSVFLFVACSTPAKKESPRTDLVEDGLKGNVMRMKENRYKAADEFGKLTKKELTSAMTVSYNQDGNALTLNSVSYMDSSTYQTKTKYLYDKKGQKIYCTKDDSSKPDQSFKYDSNGNLTEISSFNENGTLSGKLLLKYDDQNHCTEYSAYLGNGSLDSRNVFKYDSESREIEKQCYGATGVLKYTVAKTYDDKGFLGSINSSREEGISQVKYIYAKIDAQGNWQTRTEYHNDIPYQINERELIYSK